MDAATTDAGNRLDAPRRADRRRHPADWLATFTRDPAKHDAGDGLVAEGAASLAAPAAVRSVGGADTGDRLGDRRPLATRACRARACPTRARDLGRSRPLPSRLG